MEPQWRIRICAAGDVAAFSVRLGLKRCASQSSPGIDHFTLYALSAAANL